LYDYLGGVIRNGGGVLIAAGGIADHVHLLARLRQETAIVDLMRLVKTNSSKWVHETFPAAGRFGWQAGYGAFTVSFSQVDEFKRYIARQEEHHRRVSFQEEYREFLMRHGFEFEERYLWE
jgi:putative transposase